MVLLVAMMAPPMMPVALMVLSPAA